MQIQSTQNEFKVNYAWDHPHNIQHGTARIICAGVTIAKAPCWALPGGIITTDRAEAEAVCKNIANGVGQKLPKEI